MPGLSSSTMSSSVKSWKTPASASMPKLMSPLMVMTSGSRFFTSRVRKSVVASDELLTLTLMLGWFFSNSFAFCGEPVRCFGFELEEIQSDGSSGAVAATCKAGRQRDCACGRESAVYNPPEFTYTSGGIRFHSRLLCIFSLLRWSGFLTTPPLLRIIEGGGFHSQLSAPVRGGKQKRRDFVTLRK